MHVEERAVRARQVYSANTGGPIFAEPASILSKTSGLGDVLSAALAPLAGRVKLAFDFDSVARGEEAAGSDVDVLLVGEAGFREVVEALYPAQATLGREVNPTVFGVDEFAAKASSEPFLRDVLSCPMIFLIGNALDLKELAGHQP